MFTESDLKVLEQQGINLEKVNWQIEQFKKGVKPIVLVRQASANDGIFQVQNSKKYIDLYDNAKLKITKFVPASGAASRMFKSLFEYVEKTKSENTKAVPLNKELKEFCNNIGKFAFYGELNSLLKEEGGIKLLFSEKNYSPAIEKLLNPDGLSYGQLPKGLLKFHLYNVIHSRTPFEEHLVEGALYACSENRVVNIHFTVSPEHLKSFKNIYKNSKGSYEKKYNVKYNIEFSIQKSSTNTIAVNPDNTPFYNFDGTLFFRPGGHGALIENLNEIDSDIIFIKNIDNVVKENKLQPTIEYKKVLAGKLLELQNNIFSLIKSIKENPSDEIIEKAFAFLKNELFLEENCIEINAKGLKRAELLIERLNRPIRVCGVVKNQGEPGGGPFYVQNSDGCISLQIVESSQVDSQNDDQLRILNSSTHFNPVDLVCATKDFSGKKFDLRKYVDNDTCFISSKSLSGKELKALELPGLWNGAMAFWNTLFVEVPVETFNPVKTVNDLLRKNHQ
jgi:hypothetical protein